MPWFAVRSVYLWGQKSDGKNVFEERIVCFEAESGDAAISKATVESAQYAEGTGLEMIEAFPERVAYEQDGETLIDGYEVWSETFESTQSLPEFYGTRYSAYEYHAD